MNKVYIFSLFLGFFVVLCSADELTLQKTLKGFEAQKLKIDQEVVDAKKDIADLKKQNIEIKKSFAANKRSLAVNSFKFTNEENAEKLATLKAEMKKLDDQRQKLIKEMKDLLESDPEYKKLNNEANEQYEEMKEIREALPKANKHYTEVLKNQKNIDAQILKIKKQIETEKESTGDNK